MIITNLGYLLLDGPTCVRGPTLRLKHFQFVSGLACPHRQDCQKCHQYSQLFHNTLFQFKLRRWTGESFRKRIFKAAIIPLLQAKRAEYSIGTANTALISTSQRKDKSILPYGYQRYSIIWVKWPVNRLYLTLNCATWRVVCQIFHCAFPYWRLSLLREACISATFCMLTI